MSDSSKACYKCGKLGHLAYACYAKKRDREAPSGPFIPEKHQQDTSIKSKVTRCYVCRKLGHLARNCTSAPATGGGPKYYEMDGKRNDDGGGALIIDDDDDDDVPPPPTLGNFDYEDLDGNAITQALDSIEERGAWDFIKSDREAKPKLMPKTDNKFFKQVFLNGSKFHAYLDSSSEKCLIKYTAAKRAHLNVQLDDTDVMSQSPSFKGKIVSIGKALATINVDNVEITNVEVFVVSDDNLNVDVVIGRSWLDHPQVVVLKTDQILFLANMNDRNFDKFRGVLQSLEVTKLLKGGGHFDSVTSDEDIASKSKRRRRNSRSKDEDSPRKNHHELIFERPPRDLMRGGRSRSRERVRDRDNRESLREKRSGRSRDRSRDRSRERSRDRFMNRHAPRR